MSVDQSYQSLKEAIEADLEKVKDGGEWKF